jgi:hypothetical protein
MGGFGLFQRKRNDEPAGGPTPVASTPGKLHSIAALMRERELAGDLEVGGASYTFAFSPATVAVTGGKIVLTGGFSVAPSSGATGKGGAVSGVTATLLSTQGGLGRAPVVRRELLAMTAQGPKTGSADEERSGHAEGKTPPEADAQPPRADDATSITEATGAAGFVGVMYLRLSPLDARALGLAADASAVQLNARLWPTSETERELQWLYSGLVAAVHGEHPDARSAAAHADAINRLLKG